jgi:hypothetical protein
MFQGTLLKSYTFFLIHRHLSIVLEFAPQAIVCPGKEDHSLGAGMSPTIRLLNVSNLSHGGSNEWLLYVH